MALAHSLHVISNDNTEAVAYKPRLRFQTVQELTSGEAIGAVAETEQSFEERAFFGFARGEGKLCPAKWLGDVVERAGRMASMRDLEERPIAISAPAAALAHPDAPMAAEAAVSRANLCPQEFRLEFSDASLVEQDDLGAVHMERFFRKGFRIGLDARRSWRTPMGASARIMVEAIRLDAMMLSDISSLSDRLDTADSADIQVYLENARWQDADAYVNLGIGAAVAPRTDG